LSRLAASGGPGAPDPRLRAWLDARLLSAYETLGAAEDGLPQGLSDTAELNELAEVESRLDSLRSRMATIEERLQGIRDDFAFHQSTEILVALAAPPDMATRVASVRLVWNGYEVGDWKLAENEQAALAAGGYQPLHRAFARPETNTVDVELELSDGQIFKGRAEVSPASDRLTVIVLEVASAAIGSRIWTL
jgi:hypothetical protein